MHKIIFCLIILLSPLTGLADEKLPLPRFVSIKSNEANVRTGPNVRYPIRWVYVKKGEPVELVAEFEHWRKVRDKQGDEGWLHESMVSGKRTAIIIGSTLQKIYDKHDESSKVIFLAEPEARIAMIACKKEWCELEWDRRSGWVQKKHLWGAYANEEFK